MAGETPMRMVFSEGADGSRTLRAEQRRSLRAVAGLMIPASPALGVPGADDETIFADVLRSLGRDADAVRQALRALDALCAGAPSAYSPSPDSPSADAPAFADLPAEAKAAAAQRLREAHPALASALVAVVARCYYRDDRVMRSLGMEPRPPFPRGFHVEQGDWSLLEPVRARGRIWRDAP